MSNIHIVVDSTANIPAEVLAKNPNLHVVPLTVTLGETAWSELELSNAALFRLAGEQGLYPRTSQPSPGEFTKAFAPAAMGQPVIMISLAGGLSGTADGARAAAKEYKGCDIHIIDSGTTAIGVSKMAEAALHMAAQNVPAAVIAGRLQQLAEATRTLFMPDSLEYLHKGGRIGGAAALFGAILQIKPILHLHAGRVQVLDKVRTRPRAVARMLEELAQPGELAYIGVAHSLVAAPAEEVYHTICRQYPNTPVVLNPISPVLSAHLGPGVIGLIFQRKL